MASDQRASKNRSPLRTARRVAGLLLLLSTALLAGLLVLRAWPAVVERQVPLSAVRDATQAVWPPAADGVAETVHAVDLFAGGIDWNERPFCDLRWPPDSTPIVAVDGVTLPAAESVDEVRLAGREDRHAAMVWTWALLFASPTPPAQSLAISLPMAPSRAALLLAAALFTAALCGWVTIRWCAATSPLGTAVRFMALQSVLLGAMVLALNLSGVLWPGLRAAEIDEPRFQRETLMFGEADVRLGWPDARRELGRRPGESDDAFARRVTIVVADTVGHAWPVRDAERFGMRIPPTENWILWLRGEVDPAQRLYSFATPQRTIERGIGICSHVSLALADLLRDESIDARVAGLGGHVVVVAESERGWLLLDPDVGVVVEGTLDELVAQPSTIHAAYLDRFRELGDSGAEETAARFVACYSPEGNEVEPAGGEGAVSARHRSIERWTYRLKWAIPATALLAGAAMLLAIPRRRVGG